MHYNLLHFINLKKNYYAPKVQFFFYLINELEMQEIRNSLLFQTFIRYTLSIYSYIIKVIIAKNIKIS